jgi:hypothetical protein
LGDPGIRHAVGLFLFQRDGMMAWLKALAPPPILENGLPMVSETGDLPLTIPTVREEIVHVLANLVVRGPQGGMGSES